MWAPAVISLALSKGRILDETLPLLTAAGVVTRIFTDLATIRVEDGLVVEEMAEGVTFERLQSVTGARLRRG